MAKLKLKLKQNSVKDFLVTQSGITITKHDFTVVDDENKDISYILETRNDLMFSPFNETFKTNDESNIKQETFVEEDKPVKKKKTKKKTTKKEE